jgi:hypothetical protein
MRLFTMNGIELHDTDSVDMLKEDDFLYFSFSKQIIPNSYQARLSIFLCAWSS